jgi:TetR/AcrR family transcriptional regulator
MGKGELMAVTVAVAEQEAGVRERLLVAALELFNRKGYAATSVREIVAAAGVTKPVLYYYFGSKEGIYLELMNGAHATFTTLLEQLTSCKGPARERISHFCTGIFDCFVDQIAVARLIYAIFFGPPQGAPYFPHEQFFDRMLDGVGDFVTEGIEAGELRQVPVRDTAWAVVSALNTVMEEQLCHSPPRIGREGLERVVNLMFDGIGQGAKR